MARMADLERVSLLPSVILIRCVHADDEGSVARDFVGLVDGGCDVLGLVLKDLKAFRLLSFSH